MTGPAARIHRLSSTPDLTGLHRLNPARYLFLLQSTAGDSRLGRYDILFAHPGTILRADSRGLSLDGQPLSGDFLTELDRLWRQQQIDASGDGNGQLPFTGGWFVFLSYDLAGQIEPSLRLSPPDPATPIAQAVRIPAAVIVDHHSGEAHVVVEPGPGQEEQLHILLDDLAAQPTPEPGVIELASLTEDEPGQYLQAIDRVKHYIREGDIFQANLSRQWNARLAGDHNPADLYEQLCHSNPAPFAGLARLDGDCTVISSSPERLVEVRNGIVRTRPIAGTHPRKAEQAADRQQSQQLLAHPKERAEHIMLIDLERNDLGRVCRPGSVRVPELMTLESYRHVHHIVSEVRGELLPGVGPVDVIRATFPGGTITGCPKVRCMQIIAELEACPRGAYTGSMGYLNHDGSMDLNILIRTLVQNGDRVSLRTGAGIVADSVPERELNETRAKAEGLLRALEGRA